MALVTQAESPYLCGAERPCPAFLRVGAQRFALVRMHASRPGAAPLANIELALAWPANDSVVRRHPHAGEANHRRARANSPAVPYYWPLNR